MQATRGFVEGTLAECRRFEETGKSCFSTATLKERIFSKSLKEKDTKLLGDSVKGDTTNSLADNAHTLSDIKTSADPIAPSEQPAHIVAQHTGKPKNGEWKLCNTRQGAASYPVQTVVKDEAWSTPVKKTELLLAEVNSSGILRGTAADGTTLPWGAKRKRTKRDREGKVQAKEIIIRSDSTRSGQPDLANAKGETKNKLKPRQKAQKPSMASSYWEITSDKMVKDEMPALQNSIADDDTSDDNIPIDLSHLQLPSAEDIANWLNYEDGSLPDADIDYMGLPHLQLPNSGDIANWLNYEDDSLPDADTDYMGLAVPKDDLADLNIF